jgi:uncharacterized protein
MLDVIAQLLRLQDRDKKILDIQNELARLIPQRQNLETKAAAAMEQLSAAKHKFKELEAARKASELDVEQRKQLIGKYSMQQYQTKKNEEYRALAHEIEQCQAEIRKLEDGQLEFMEQAETAQKEIAAANAVFTEANQVVASKLAELKASESSLLNQSKDLQAGREALACAVDTSARARYERLFQSKNGRVLVGVDHGVCGGCHMKLPAQSVITCQSGQEIVTCPNCGRILFYSQGMDLTVAD